MAVSRAHHHTTTRSTSASSWDAVNNVLRVVGIVAGAVAVVIALVAAARLDWGNGFDAEAVSVVGMDFTPAIAIATGVAGLIALAAAAAADRAAKLLVGAVLACVGVAVLIAGDTASDLDLASGHGWLALVIGAILVATGVLMHRGWTTREEVDQDLV
jgi:hypothetical protein